MGRLVKNRKSTTVSTIRTSTWTSCNGLPTGKSDGNMQTAICDLDLRETTTPTTVSDAQLWRRRSG